MLKVLISSLFIICAIVCIFQIIKINRISLRYKKSVLSPSLSQMTIEERMQIKKYFKTIAWAIFLFIASIVILFISNASKK